MQSEIDEIREAIGALGILRDLKKLDCDEVNSFIGFVSERLDRIELQQADQVVKVPVLTLAIISHRARQERQRHLTVIDGEKL
ncbi:MAG: hypothetical protein DI568_08905 [Sphingomonas sp.]|nr:MAG: hypothetical protein DI568_08905 [Sphingomonas sp.]